MSTSQSNPNEVGRQPFTRGGRLGLHRVARRVSVSAAIATLVLAAAVLPVAAQQYTAPGIEPTSAIPPNTPLDANPFVNDQGVTPVNNPAFGIFGNMFQIVDQTPQVLAADYPAYTASNATDDEQIDAVYLGVVPAGTVVQPMFVRGTRTLVYLLETGDVVWLDSTPAPMDQPATDPPADTGAAAGNR